MLLYVDLLFWQFSTLLSALLCTAISSNPRRHRAGSAQEEPLLNLAGILHDQIRRHPSSTPASISSD